MKDKKTYQVKTERPIRSGWTGKVTGKEVITVTKAKGYLEDREVGREVRRIMK